MEGFCWNCNRPGHHKRECTNPPEPNAKRELKREFDKGSGKELKSSRNAVQLERREEKAAWKMTQTLLPLSFVKHEESRLSNLLHDNCHQLENLSSPVSADCARLRLSRVIKLTEEWSQESENVRLLYALKVPYDLGNFHPLTDEGILLEKIDLLHGTHRTFSDNLHALTSKLKAMVKVYAEFQDLGKKLRNFVETGMEAFSGRPLLVSQILGEWTTMKETKRTMADLLQKYAYMFSGPDLQEMHDKMDAITKTWKVLKSMKNENENEASVDDPMACKICLSSKIEITLRCGHVMCQGCSQKVKACPVCRGSLTGRVKLFF